MASLSAGVCPKCNEHLLIKQGLIFLVCPLCGENIRAVESKDTLEKNYADPAKLTDHIATVLRLEKKYGPQLPYQILLVLKKNFPHNEEVAFLALKFSDFSSFMLKEYLTNFAKFQKPVSFAVEVLENGLTPRHWELAPLFEQYIKNKTTGAVKERWLGKLREMNAAIAMNPVKDYSGMLMHAFYIGCGILNVLLALLFVFFPIPYFVSVPLGLAVLAGEMLILYRHAKKHGNRLTIPDRERAFMVLFMCASVILIGGVIIGWLNPWNFWG
jgi:predicted RNA-binding Zn-ribbon protein involved in translation (DUF1610 family)